MHRGPGVWVPVTRIRNKILTLISVTLRSVPRNSTINFNFMSFDVFLQKILMYSSPLIEALLFLIATLKPSSTDQKSDSFWKLTVIMRQTCPFVIKQPAHSIPRIGTPVPTFSFEHMSLLIKSFACLKVLWKQYSFLWYCCPRRKIRKAP